MTHQASTFTPSPFSKENNFGWRTVGPGKPMSEFIKVHDQRQRVESSQRKFLGMREDNCVKMEQHEDLPNSSLVNNKEYHDVVFFCGPNKTKIYAYQGILASRSNYFKNLFAMASDDLRRQQQERTGRRNVSVPLFAETEVQSRTPSNRDCGKETMYLKFTLREVEAPCLLRVLEWAYTDVVFGEMQNGEYNRDENPRFGGDVESCSFSEPELLCMIAIQAKKWDMKNLVHQLVRLLQGNWDGQRSTLSWDKHTPGSSKRIHAQPSSNYSSVDAQTRWESWHYELFEQATQHSLTEIQHALFVRSSKCVNMFNSKDVEHFAVLSPLSLQALFGCDSIFPQPEQEFSKFRIVAQWFTWHFRSFERRFSTHNLAGLLRCIQPAHIPLSLIRDFLLESGVFDTAQLLHACLNNQVLRQKNMKLEGFPGFAVRVIQDSGDTLLGFATAHEAPTAPAPTHRRSTGFFFNTVRFGGTEEEDKRNKVTSKGQVFVCYDDGFDDGWTENCNWEVLDANQARTESEWFQEFVHCYQDSLRMENLENKSSTLAICDRNELTAKPEKFIYLIDDGHENRTIATSMSHKKEMISNHQLVKGEEGKSAFRETCLTWTHEKTRDSSRMYTPCQSTTKKKIQFNHKVLHTNKKQTPHTNKQTKLRTAPSSSLRGRTATAWATETPGTSLPTSDEASYHWNTVPHTDRTQRTSVTFAKSVLTGGNLHGRADSHSPVFTENSTSFEVRDGGKGSESVHHTHRDGGPARKQNEEKHSEPQASPIFQEPVYKHRFKDVDDSKISPLPAPPPVIRSNGYSTGLMSTKSYKKERVQFPHVTSERNAVPMREDLEFTKVEEGRSSVGIHQHSKSLRQAHTSNHFAGATHSSPKSGELNKPFAQQVPVTPPTSPQQRCYPNSDKKRESPYRLDLTDAGNLVSSPLKRARTLHITESLDPRNLNNKFRGLDLANLSVDKTA